MHKQEKTLHVLYNEVVKGERRVELLQMAIGVWMQ
jgi:hypothetical protein